MKAAVIQKLPVALPAKHYRPPPRSDRVIRPGLLQLLDRGVDHRLIVVTASAGSGKTTLVSDWIESMSLDCCWLSLDERDDDPIVFWQNLVLAVRTVAPAFAGAVMQMLKGERCDRIRNCVLAYCEDLAMHPATATGSHYIALDDYHNIKSDIVHQSVDLLIRHLPDNWRLIILSRTAPPLALAHLHVEESITEITEAQLRFSTTEILQFMNNCAHVVLDDHELRVLEERTEGWPVALQLVTLSMNHADDKKRFLRNLVGDERLIQGYLTEEVLRHQSEDVQCFIKAIAPLERFCEPLCQTIMQEIPQLCDQDARGMIEYLERANLFTIPLDDKHQWFRFHHLFRQLLLVQGDKTPTRTLKAAGVWLQNNGFTDDALGLALSIEDYQWAESLIWTSAFPESQWFKVKTWLRRLPEDYVVNSPTLVFLGTIISMQTGQPRAALYWLNCARDLEQKGVTAAIPELQLQLKFFALLANAWIDISRDRFESTLHALGLVQQYLDGESGKTGLLSARIRVVLTELLFQLGRIPETIVDAETGIEQARQLAMGMASGALYSRLGEALAAAGKLRKTHSTVSQGLQFLSTTTASDQLNATGHLTKLQAEYFLERYKLDEARDILMDLRERAQQESHHYLDMGAGLLLSIVKRCKGKLNASRALLTQVSELADEQLLKFWFTPSPRAQIARLDLMAGNKIAARDWAHAAQFDPDYAFPFYKEHDGLIYTRLLMAENQPDIALSVLQRIQRQSMAAGRGKIVLESLILETLANHACDRPFIEPLSRALAIAIPEGYIRLFIDEDPVLLKLLAALKLKGPEADFVSQLTRYAGATNDHTDRILSPRETEVLMKLAVGNANKEIAQQLNLSPHTVKTHIRNIYEKLSVSNRTQAVSRASVLGIISQ